MDGVTEQQHALEMDLDMRRVAVLVEQVMREDDADDPTLEFYQRKYGSKS
jgi:hypothetical protein